MTATGGVAESTGWDEAAARAWIEGGTNENEYRFPWQLAIAVAAEEAPAGEFVILDAASGPGGFLAAALELLPAAKGIWYDNFETMEATARDNLAGFGDRVDYRVGDLIEIEKHCERESVSLVTCSRATHHLDDEGLARFYEQALRVLAPGGWVANLDSMTLPGTWGARLSAARRRLNGAAELRERDPNHPKGHPHSAEDHIGLASSAGFGDVAAIWRHYQHAVLMARKPA
jgi:SAM-dependent methyltransferase